MKKIEDWKKYKPNFNPYTWSEQDRFLLQPFVSNPDSLITVLRSTLPPEIVGALCSRASRASSSLLEVLLKEYFYPIINGEDKKLAQELLDTITFLHKSGFKNILNNGRAQAFYAKWLSQYGDDSIAQMTGTHVVFWGISQVAIKFIEDQRIGLEPIEKSTRYVNFGNKINNQYLYYTPKPALEKFNLAKDYHSTLNNLFDTYVELLPPLIAWLKKNYNDKDSVLEKKAFDTLRGLLPMATLGQVAFRGNAQAFEYLINRTRKHALGELRWVSEEIKGELDQEIPSLLLRINDEKSGKYQNYLNDRYGTVREFTKELPNNLKKIKVSSQPEVKLAEYDKEAEIKILAGIFFQQTHVSWEDATKIVKKLSNAKKEKLFKAYLNGRMARWFKVGRAFENSYVRFDITMDIGSYRDLHRHRMMTQERQLFSTHHGYSVPKELIDANLENNYIKALDQAKKLFKKIEQHDPCLAQYAVPLAYRVRFYQWQNFRQLFWESELRTIPQGHPDYRFIEQEKCHLIQEKFPMLSKFMLVDMNNYSIARRGTEEKILEKEKDILKKLSDK